MRRFFFSHQFFDKHLSFNMDGLDPEMLDDEDLAEEARIRRHDPLKFVPIDEIPDPDYQDFDFDIQEEMQKESDEEKFFNTETISTTVSSFKLKKNGRGKNIVMAMCSPTEIMVFRGFLENNSREREKFNEPLPFLPFFEGFGKRKRKKKY